MKKAIDMVMDLQYGSTGKGLLAGWLAQNGQYDTIMTAWAPNAGHTYINYQGKKFVHTMLANGIVGASVKRVMMGPGSVLDLDKLAEEIHSNLNLIVQQRISIFIHPHAAIVLQEHRDEEAKTMTAIGSTKKGVGAAIIDRIRRNPDAAVVASEHWGHQVFEYDFVSLVNSPMEWAAIYSLADRILIEGAQGFGLSMYHGFYPYVTSRDVTPCQILADCGIPFGDMHRVNVHGTCRTYPIRVANRFDEEGKQVGYSGPGYSDQVEIQWADLGLEAELTTVTKLPRRIFSFSHQQMQFAMDMCAPNTVFLNFVNYLKTYEQFEAIYRTIEASGASIIYGIGPTALDVVAIPQTGPQRAWEHLSMLIAEANDE
jgi:adenylosuccinate synthase